MSLCGTSEGHCCWLKGSICPHVIRVDRPDRIWACSLFDKYGNWTDVHNSPEYIKDVQPMWDEHSIKGKGCGDFPLMGMTCMDCGEIG